MQRLPGTGGAPEAGAAEARVLAGPGMVTAIAGLTFAISDELGDMAAAGGGLIVDDTRHLSHLRLLVNGMPLHRLGAGLIDSDEARFHGYPDIATGPDAAVEAVRSRTVRPHRLDDRIELRSWATEPVEATVALEVACDFADIFEVRRVAAPPAEHRAVAGVARGGDLTFGSGSLATTVRFAPAPQVAAPGRAAWRVVLPPHGSWELRVSVVASREGHGRSHEPGEAPWEPATTVWSEPPALGRGVRMSVADLRALSLQDDLDPDRRLVAAGIPWFVALFGRDSIVASLQARAFDPGVALATLRALAARQGRVHDPGNAEEPGKILHEVRLTHRPWLGEGTTDGGRPYFGSVDATPLFLVLLASAWRWGASRDAVEELLPAARAALGWLRGPGDPDGDGFVEYAPSGPRSLTNQGWKDSENAVQFRDGSLAEAPIALAEVQGYAHVARREMGALLGWLGHDAEAADLAAEAEVLRAAIRERFWIPGSGDEPGFFALALDGAKRRVDAVASNMGHLLWCGVPDDAEAEQVARRLLAPDMASGWGLRTLSSLMEGFNPISYHLGSVWPHDTAIACEGLRRYGHDAAALTLASALLDALVAFEGRLPELFGGHARAGRDFPVPYPTACRPQAWAAGVPLAFVPLFLGLEPSIPDGVISLAPALPPEVTELEVRGIPFPGGGLSVAATGTEVRLIASPPGVSVEIRPRG